MQSHQVIVVAVGSAPTYIATPADSRDEALADLFSAVDDWHDYEARCARDAQEGGAK
jgi:hypothetical protein